MFSQISSVPQKGEEKKKQDYKSMGKLNKNMKIRLNMELLSKSSWTMGREQYDKTKTLGSLEKKNKETWGRQKIKGSSYVGLSQ